MAEEIKFASPDTRTVKALRFLNVLDDAHNMVSWTKVNVMGSTLSAGSAALAAIWAWLTGHKDMLEHVLSMGTVLGGWIAHAQVSHIADKTQRAKAAAEMARINGGK